MSRFINFYLSENEIPDFVDIGGTKRPTKNGDNELIHKSLDGIINFWKWFGNSKMVDSKGRPRVFYHQSQTRIMDMFKTKGIKRPSYSQAKEGIYFSDDKDMTEAKYKKNEKGQLVSAYLKIETPLDLGDKDSMYFDGKIVSYGKIVTDNFKKSMKGEPEAPEPDIILYTISKKASKWLSKNGYDGVIGGEFGGHEEYVVFNSSQIKSIDNSGLFSNSQYIYEMPMPINDLEHSDEEIVEKTEKFYNESTDEDYDVKYGITFTLCKSKNHNGIFIIIQDEDDEFIGYVKANPFIGYVRDKDFKRINAVQIQIVEIISDRQGEGIGTDAYRYLLEHYDYIVSDEQLTDGSINLYKKLSKEYKPMIFTKTDGLKDVDFTKLSDVEIDKFGKDMFFVLARK